MQLEFIGDSCILRDLIAFLLFLNFSFTLKNELFSSKEAVNLNRRHIQL